MKTFKIVEKPVTTAHGFVVRTEYVLVKSDEIFSATYVTRASLNREVKALKSEGWTQA